MKKLMLALIMVLAPGCGGGNATGKGEAEKPPADTRTLYQRLGGLDAISAIVDDFVTNVAGDGRINARFAKANIPHLKSMLVDQICATAGGPCAYGGKSMEEAHKGMRITDGEFNALVADLERSLDKAKVGPREKGELLGALGGMKWQIVGK
jgi:hemoglobin